MVGYVGVTRTTICVLLPHIQGVGWWLNGHCSKLGGWVCAWVRAELLLHVLLPQSISRSIALTIENKIKQFFLMSVIVYPLGHQDPLKEE